MTEGNRQPVSFCSALSQLGFTLDCAISASSLFAGVFQVGSGPTVSMLAVCDSSLDCVEVCFWLMMSPFLALSVLLVVLLLFCVPLDEDCNPG